MELQERIARALWDHGEATLGEEFAVGPWEEIDQGYRDGYLEHADAVIAALGLREVATIAWDGEPSMSGEPHRMSLGGDHDPATLRRAILEVGSVRFKPGARVERRFVTEWERDDG